MVEQEDLVALVKNGEPNASSQEVSSPEKNYVLIPRRSNNNNKDVSLLAISICLFLASVATFVYDKRMQLSQLPNPIHNDNVIYGHVHIAKTAGSTVNGELAMHYERVCGNKGYSYDAYETNERYKREGHGDIAYSGDIYSTLDPNHNRGKIPPWIMDEIGYQDCDVIAVERKWKFWNKQFGNWSVPLELIVPCRDPVDHLMSQCNHKEISFHCNRNSDAMMDQIEQCLLTMNRFNLELLEQFPIKCYEYEKTPDYVEWMGERLERKRIETTYAMRFSNAPRDKEKECVWYRPKLRQVITEYLRENVDYYKFCHECIGSENDLFGERGGD